MSLLPPEKWRFCKLSPASLSSTENKNQCRPSTTSAQTSPSQSAQSSPSSIPRINKNHGFLKHIIKNQIERDEYHKASIARNSAERNPHQISQNRAISPCTTPTSSKSSSTPLFISNNGLQNDPHSELRARARRSLQREGML